MPYSYIVWTRWVSNGCKHETIVCSTCVIESALGHKDNTNKGQHERHVHGQKLSIWFVSTSQNFDNGKKVYTLHESQDPLAKFYEYKTKAYYPFKLHS